MLNWILKGLALLGLLFIVLIFFASLNEASSRGDSNKDEEQAKFLKEYYKRKDKKK